MDTLESLLMQLKPPVGVVRLTLSGSVCSVEVYDPAHKWAKLATDTDPVEACRKSLARELHTPRAGAA